MPHIEDKDEQDCGALARARLGSVGLCPRMGRDKAAFSGWLVVFMLLSGLLACSSGARSTANEYAAKRSALIEHLEDYASSAGTTGEPLDPAVLRAMQRVPRHEFVPTWVRGQAYEDHPLPIGYEQTISQPYIVALMTDLLDLKPDDTVLEVGTGSGYQAAVLAELVRRVYTIEIVEPLAEEAARRLKRLGYDNVITRSGDGYHGWKEHAPFDAVMVTAGASRVPPPLIRQLQPGGKMVIPVDSGFFSQHLMLLTKTQQGKVETRRVIPVRFVPLTGDH
jgi:protein-L-isoaspartate(D-aspartate) O-methyltransferase